MRLKMNQAQIALPLHHKSGLKRPMQKVSSQSPGDTEVLLPIEI